MTSPRTVTVVLNSELLTLGRTCGVLRRRNLPIRGFAVDSSGPPGLWRLSCVIDADDVTVENLLLQFQNVVGVRKATVVVVGAQHAAPLQSSSFSESS